MASAQSVLVSAIGLVGVVSFLVVATAALVLLYEVLQASVPIEGCELRGSLGRLYWGSLSPLVHRPVRRLVLRAIVAVTIVIAPATPVAW